MHAQAAGWPVPVFEHKDETDANFERCARLLHDHHGEVRAAFGSHNLRSLAYAVAYAPSARASPTPATRSRCSTAWPSRCTRRSGASGCGCGSTRRSASSCRAWRTSCAGCSRTRPTRASSATASPRARARRAARAARRRHAARAATAAELAERPPTRRGPRRTRPSRWPSGGGRRCPGAFAAAVDAAATGADARRPRRHRRRAGARRPRRSTASTPATFDRVVAPSAASCTASDADAAVAAAVAAARTQWRRTPAAERAAVLFRAAGVDARAPQRARRARGVRGGQAVGPGRRRRVRGHRLLRVLRPRDAAARRVERATRCSRRPASATGSRYQGKGVTVVIAPWNFPLAIPCGMTAAALVAGNPVILKPAEQTPAIAWQLVRGVRRRRAAAGRAAVPARRRRGGRRPARRAPGRRGHRVHRLEGRRPRTSTRSPPCTAPGQRHVKRVIAEMGGKNAIIVDADADLDQAVPAVVHVGVRLRRPEVLGRVARDRPRPRLRRVRRPAGRRDRARWCVGHPRDMATQVGPVIDADAARAADRGDRAGGRAEARSARRSRDDVPDRRAGSSAPTSSPSTIPTSAVAPRRAVRTGARRPASPRLRRRHRARQRHRRTRSRPASSPARPRTSSRPRPSSAAGNVYINRGTTGAVVGRQPFGGLRPVGRRLEGRRARLPAAVPRPAGGHREHRAPGLRGRRVTESMSGVAAGADRPGDGTHHPATSR